MYRFITLSALAGFVLAGALMTGCDTKSGTSANPPQSPASGTAGPKAILPTSQQEK